jgi:hypothetical protein
MQEVVRKLIRHLGKPYSSQIGINLESKKESEFFIPSEGYSVIVLYRESPEGLLSK